MNEFETRYFPLKKKYPCRVKKYSRDRELPVESRRFSRDLHIRRITLPATVETAVDKRLLFVSDWHWHNSERNRQLLSQWQELVRQYPADAVILGGDLCDDAEFLPSLPVLLAELGKSAPTAVAVKGNWETGKRWLSDDFFPALFAKYGITILENQLLSVGGFNFFGLPDISSVDFHHLPPPKLPENKINILLTHSPDAVVAADKRGFLRNFHLALCGHTHGGQIRLPLLGACYCPSFYRCKFDRGIFSRRDSDLKMIVSSGIGEHHNSKRFCCPPEAVLLEFTK